MLVVPVRHPHKGAVVQKRSFAWLFVFVITVTCFAAQRGPDGSTPGEQFVGTWSGSWEGAGSGGFELTLEKAKDGALAGRVSVTGEPTYKATLKTVSFDGAKMSAKYDFPPAEGAEVILAATFDGKGAKGTWSVRDKAKGNEAVNGTWTVTKK
jgi:hypothetical protein